MSRVTGRAIMRSKGQRSRSLGAEKGGCILCQPLATFIVITDIRKKTSLVVVL